MWLFGAKRQSGRGLFKAPMHLNFPLRRSWITNDVSRRDVYVLTVWAVQVTCNTATLDVNYDVRNTVFAFLLARPAYIMFYLAQIFRGKGKLMDWEKKKKNFPNVHPCLGATSALINNFYMMWSKIRTSRRQIYIDIYWWDILTWICSTIE